MSLLSRLLSIPWYCGSARVPAVDSVMHEARVVREATLAVGALMFRGVGLYHGILTQSVSRTQPVCMEPSNIALVLEILISIAASSRETLASKDTLYEAVATAKA